MADEQQQRDELEDIAAQIGRLVQRFAELKSELDQEDHELVAHPYVAAWVLGYEFTSPALELAEKAGRGQIVPPTGQLIATSCGLARYLETRFE